MTCKWNLKGRKEPAREEWGQCAGRGNSMFKAPELVVFGVSGMWPEMEVSVETRSFGALRAMLSKWVDG